MYRPVDRFQNLINPTAGPQIFVYQIYDLLWICLSGYRLSIRITGSSEGAEDYLRRMEHLFEVLWENRDRILHRVHSQSPPLGCVSFSGQLLRLLLPMVVLYKNCGYSFLLP